MFFTLGVISQWYDGIQRIFYKPKGFPFTAYSSRTIAQFGRQKCNSSIRSETHFCIKKGTTTLPKCATPHLLRSTFCQKGCVCLVFFSCNISNPRKEVKERHSIEFGHYDI